VTAARPLCWTRVLPAPVLFTTAYSTPPRPSGARGARHAADPGLWGPSSHCSSPVNPTTTFIYRSINNYCSCPAFCCVLTVFRGALAALPIDAAVNAPLVDSSPFDLTVSVPGVSAIRPHTCFRPNSGDARLQQSCGCCICTCQQLLLLSAAFPELGHGCGGCRCP
jgi:hypothetical protein